MSEQGHIPVLAQECLMGLNLKPDGVYVDATFGRGGHSQLILDALGQEGKLYAFDQDESAILYAQTIQDDRFKIYHQNFAMMAERLKEEGVAWVDGVLMDIGVSSPQLDEASRGFSFMREGPLDMRMDQTQDLTAYQYLLQVSEAKLCDDIYWLGEERSARRIAKAIVQARQDRKLKDSTQSLVEIILASGARRDKHKHPATRTFQAIRMVVNQEMEVLEKGMLSALGCLKVGGRLVVISFHGLEHRCVKAFIRRYRQKDGEVVLRMIGKAQGVSVSERRENPRARSAYVRVMERVK